MGARTLRRTILVCLMSMALLLTGCRDDDSAAGSDDGTSTSDSDATDVAAETPDPVYAYYGGGYVSVRDGTDQVARVQTSMCCSNAPGMAWSDDRRYLAIIDSELLHVVDVESGETWKRPCACATTVAIWGDRVISAKSSYASVSRPISYALPDLSDPKPLEGNLPASPYWQAFETVGEDLMAVVSTDSGGARDLMTTLLLHPDGTTGAIGEARSGYQVAAEYAPDTAYGGPRVAYVWSASGGACSSVDSVILVDPTGGSAPVRADDSAVFPTNGLNATNIFHDVWFGSDGALYASAYSLSYCSGTAAKMLSPVSVWRLDGSRWVKADDRALLAARDVGPASRVELLTQPTAPSVSEARMTGGTLTWSSDGQQREIARLAVTVSAPPTYVGPEPTEPTEPTPTEPDPTVAAMAEQFAPLVYLAEGEKNRPANASTFVQRSELMWDLGPKCLSSHVVASDVTEPELASGGYSYQAQTRCSDHAPEGPEFSTKQDTAPKHSELVPGLQGFYLDLDDAYRSGDSGAAPMYWEYVEGPQGSGEAAILYWLFYAYNDYNNNHEGDWERVAVQVKDGQPAGVTFWKHNEPACMVEWSRLDNWEGHPITYAAKGSHGSYASAGEFKHPGGTDHTSQGDEWETWETATPVQGEAWWGYAGAWGEQFYLNNVPGLKEFSGPDGPNPVYDKGAARANALTDRSCGIVSTVFQGQWKSTEAVEMPDSMRSTIELRIRDGALGDEVGTVSYDTLGCRGDLTLVAVEEVRMEVSVRMHSLDPSLECQLPGGTIVVTARGGGLRYHHTGAPDEPDWALSTDLVRR